MRELELRLQLCERDRISIKRQMELKEDEWSVKEQELRTLI